MVLNAGSSFEGCVTWKGLPVDGKNGREESPRVASIAAYERMVVVQY
jgi:hypothetical protein